MEAVETTESAERATIPWALQGLMQVVLAEAVKATNAGRACVDVDYLGATSGFGVTIYYPDVDWTKDHHTHPACRWRTYVDLADNPAQILREWACKLTRIDLRGGDDA